MEDRKQKWEAALGAPSAAAEVGEKVLLCRYEEEDYTLELYRQPLADGTFQRVMLAFPGNAAFPAPAVAVPFYYPEAMLGYDPATGEELPCFAGVEMMVHLVKRGYIAACADAYHLTYADSTKARDDFTRWRDAAGKLHADHPHWSGMGKLISDTRRMIDGLCEDARVDSARVGVAGHSLGGKMAFYTGCLDERVKVILASDFGFGWEQSNWDEPWYWNGRVKELEAMGLDHTVLLELAAPKPFCLLAGEYDDASSGERMGRALGYASDPAHLKLVHHGKGHRPTAEALAEGYEFLDSFLK